MLDCHLAGIDRTTPYAVDIEFALRSLVNAKLKEDWTYRGSAFTFRTL